MASPVPRKAWFTELRDDGHEPAGDVMSQPKVEGNPRSPTKASREEGAAPAGELGERGRHRPQRRGSPQPRASRKRAQDIAVLRRPR